MLKLRHKGKSENPYHVFDLKVGERGRWEFMWHATQWVLGGAFDTTVKLLKKAKDEGWKLGCIFVIGCCGVSVTDQKECPRGTVLLARQVKDYLNTEKVVGGKVTGTALNIPMSTMCPRGLCEFTNVQMANRLDPHRIEVQIVDFLTGPLVIKDNLFGKAYCEANAEVTGVEMEIVGVIKAVEAFHILDRTQQKVSGDPNLKVVLTKGVSDYTGKKGDQGKCKLFGKGTPPTPDICHLAVPCSSHLICGYTHTLDLGSVHLKSLSNNYSQGYGYLHQ